MNADASVWRRAVLSAVLASITASFTAAARADESPRTARVHIALRTGFGVPFGKYADARTLASVRAEDVNSLRDDTYGVIPLWLDVGYRLHPHFVLGAYFMYGIVLPKTARASEPLGGGCPEDLDCSASGVRFGIQAQFAFAPGRAIDPWIGLALGYERIQSKLTGKLFGLDFDAATTHSGPDLLQVQAGLDFRSSEEFVFGPFVAASAMQYSSCSIELSGVESSCEIDDPGWHGWLVLGGRGAFEL